MDNTIHTSEMTGETLKDLGKSLSDSVVDATHLGVETIIVTPEFYPSYF